MYYKYHIWVQTGSNRIEYIWKHENQNKTKYRKSQLMVGVTHIVQMIGLQCVTKDFGEFLWFLSTKTVELSAQSNDVLAL